MISVKEVRRQIEAFRPGDDRASRSARRRILSLLEHGKDALNRRNYDPGHLTTSAVVLSPDRRAVLLVYHRRLERWLQPGGHLERDDDALVDAAAREVKEETGVALRRDVVPVMVGVGVHEIPAAKGEPEHLHHDVVWRFVAGSARPGTSRERRRTVWCPVDALSQYEADLPLLHSVRRALARRG